MPVTGANRIEYIHPTNPRTTANRIKTKLVNGGQCVWPLTHFASFTWKQFDR